jgi:hypothetical protein
LHNSRATPFGIRVKERRRERKSIIKNGHFVLPAMPLDNKRIDFTVILSLCFSRAIILNAAHSGVLIASSI